MLTMAIVVTATPIRPFCRKCGTGKAGKLSCCGKGGSWFRNCGSTGNSKLGHTWYEGIQVCKTRPQSKTASSKWSNARRHNSNESQADAGKASNSQAVATASFAFTAHNPSAALAVSPPIVRQGKMSATVSINASATASDRAHAECDTGTTYKATNRMVEEAIIAIDWIPTGMHAIISIYFVITWHLRACTFSTLQLSLPPFRPIQIRM